MLITAANERLEIEALALDAGEQASLTDVRAPVIPRVVAGGEGRRRVDEIGVVPSVVGACLPTGEALEVDGALGGDLTVTPGSNWPSRLRYVTDPSASTRPSANVSNTPTGNDSPSTRSYDGINSPLKPAGWMSGVCVSATCGRQSSIQPPDRAVMS